MVRGRAAAVRLIAPLALVVAVIALAGWMRAPMFAWPVAYRIGEVCCGHPDELNHYEIVRGFRRGVDRGNYPPGMAFLTFLLAPATSTVIAERTAAPAVSGEERDRIGTVLTARVIAGIASGLAVVLLFLLCIATGIRPWMAAVSAPLLALAPLYAVQSGYGLADIPNVSSIVAYAWVFTLWLRAPRVSLELLFGLLTGAAVAFKYGVAIGAVLFVWMLWHSPRRWRTGLASGLALVFGVAVFSGGFLRFVSSDAILHLVVSENVGAARVTPAANAVHHLLSLLTGLGALFVTIALAVSFSCALGRACIRNNKPALGLKPLVVASLVYFVIICFSSNPFVRHALPLYPFLILFTLTGAQAMITRFPEAWRPSLVLLLCVAIGYNSFASFSVVRSFVRDPLLEATAWIESRNLEVAPLNPTRNSRPPLESGHEVITAHSAWLGRATGSWWLKPAPKTVADAYHFRQTDAELRFWQDVMSGRSTEWVVIASFGEDWNTPERLFLTLLNRGYDQWTTAGRLYVLERR